MIIKVDLDGDVRRINMALSEDAIAAQKFDEIRAAVAQGFDMEETSLPVLKYRDEEGDMCTLVEASVEDLLELSNSGTIRLFASMPAMPLVKEDVAHKMSDPSSLDVQPDEIESSTRGATNDTNTQDATVAASCQEIATDDKAVSNTSDVHMEADSAPPSAAAVCLSKAASPFLASETQGVAELIAMGFSEEQSVFAMECAQGSVEGAVEHLLHGTQQQHQQGDLGCAAASRVGGLQASGSDSGAHEGLASPEQKACQQQNMKNATKMDCAQVFLAKSISAFRSGLTSTVSPSRACGSESATADSSTSARWTGGAETIESKLRSLPGNVMEQLQKVQGQMHHIVATMKQHKSQGPMDSSKSAEFQNLQETLQAMLARLGEFRELVQAALKNATGDGLRGKEEERLVKVEAEITDAHRFLTETLNTLLNHASEAFKRNDTAAIDGVAVAMETMDVVVTAAMDAAFTAMAAVDEILFVDVESPAAASTAANGGYTQPASATTDDAFLLAPTANGDQEA